VERQLRGFGGKRICLPRRAQKAQESLETRYCQAFAALPVCNYMRRKLVSIALEFISNARSLMNMGRSFMNIDRSLLSKGDKFISKARSLMNIDRSFMNMGGKFMSKGAMFMNLAGSSMGFARSPVNLSRMQTHYFTKPARTAHSPRPMRDFSPNSLQML